MQLRVPLVRLDAVLRERVDATLLRVVQSVVGCEIARDSGPGHRAGGGDVGHRPAAPRARAPRRVAVWLERLRSSGKWRADPSFVQHLASRGRFPAWGTADPSPS